MLDLLVTHGWDEPFLECNRQDLVGIIHIGILVQSPLDVHEKLIPIYVPIIIHIHCLQGLLSVHATITAKVRSHESVVEQ